MSATPYDLRQAVREREILLLDFVRAFSHLRADDPGRRRAAMHDLEALSARVLSLKPAP